MLNLIMGWSADDYRKHCSDVCPWWNDWISLMYVTGIYIDGNRASRVQVNTHNHTCISQMIGGDFDVVTLTGRNGELFSVFVQDTGLINGLDVNIVASILSGIYLVGPAVVTGTTKAGETTHVSVNIMGRIHEIVEAMGIHQAFATQEEAFS